MPLILVVDDEDSQRRLVRVILQKNLGLQEEDILEAASAEKAEELIRTEPYDLAILDGRLGKIEDAGIKLASLSKELRSTIPVIIISAYLEDDDLENEARRVANSFVSKPYPPQALVTMAKKLLDREVEETRGQDKPHGAD